MPENAKDRASLNNAKAQAMVDEAPSDTRPCPYMKRLRLGVFFDGTGNNRYRDEATSTNTNVDRLYNVYHHDEDEIAARAKLYLIGLGAVDPEKERFGDANRRLQATGEGRVQAGVQAMETNPESIDLRVFTGEDGAIGGGLGLAFGLGAHERLNIAYKWVKETVTAHEGKYLKESEKVVDVYGFSRGAAMARTFVNLVKQGLQQKEGFLNVRVRFLGIFDTVGSIGIPGGLPGGSKNPGQNLGLDSGDFDACSHFTARDEVRANFPLSELPGFDREYAGVHSDVGGGYADGSPAGTHNHLAFIALEDMYQESKNRLVELDPPALPGGVDLEALRKDADIYEGQTPVMYDPDGSFPKERAAWYETYVHHSATQVSNWWYLGGPVLHGVVSFFNPNKARTEGFFHPHDKRQKFVHKKRKLASLPPNFSWT
jgi:hypothetical protein